MGLNNNNNLQFFTIVLSPEKVNKHYRQKNSLERWQKQNQLLKIGSGANELLYGVIKLSPLMKLKIIERY